MINVCNDRDIADILSCLHFSHSSLKNNNASGCTDCLRHCRKTSQSTVGRYAIFLSEKREHHCKVTVTYEVTVNYDQQSKRNLRVKQELGLVNRIATRKNNVDLKFHN